MGKNPKMISLFKQNDYKFGYHSVSEEAAGLKTHKYVSLGYARSF